MKHIKINNIFHVPQIVVGCMRISDIEEKKIDELISTAIELGANFFDHADIYGGGNAEKVFAKSINNLGIKREEYVLQSKCGIRDGLYDFSKDHILSSVDGILKRLNTDYLDFLLLHRPDTLMEPEEVSEAFMKLHASGKVKKFGVSNQKPMQIELLQKYLNYSLVINQLQFSVTNTGMIDSGLNVNMSVNGSIDRDGSILEYCRLNNITIQTWSPFQYGFFEGVFIGSPKHVELNKVLTRIAKENNVTSTAIATAFILRHPANMQVISGTTKASRLKEIVSACDIELSRDEWYEIYKSAGNSIP